MHPPLPVRRPMAVAAIAALLALAPACGSVIASVETEYSDPQSVPVTDVGVVITGTDYAYSGIPSALPAGTTIRFTNTSTTEAHELVVFPIAEDETRPAEELWQDLAPSAEPVLVTVAGPGDDGQVYVGDGTLGEPGRYLAVCFLPVGADPETIFEQDGPPESDAPPHAANGMVAEIEVEA